MLIAKRRGLSSPDENQVYITVLTNENYIPGVMALVRSLKKVGTTHEIIILVPTSMYQFLLNKIKNYGILKFRGVKILSTDDLHLPNELTEQEHYWSNTFFKLKVFSLEQFSKIILIDSDMLVQKNIDCLFEQEHMAAVVAGQSNHPEWDTLNSGLIVITPNENLYQELFRTIPTTYRKRKLAGYATGDQDIIHDVFPKWSSNMHLHLDEQYNMFWSSLRIYCTKNNCKTKDISIIHFIGSTKPWNYEFKRIAKMVLSSIKHFDLFRLKMTLVLVKYILLTKPL